MVKQSKYIYLIAIMAGFLSTVAALLYFTRAPRPSPPSITRPEDPPHFLADKTIFDDAVIGTDTSETFSGLMGSDIIYARKGNDTLYGGLRADKLYGEEGNDWLEGGIDNDYLYGGSGNDTLIGGFGTDHLYGGKGDDILRGGHEADFYYYKSNDGSDVIEEGRGSGTDTLIFVDLKRKHVEFTRHPDLDNFDLIIKILPSKDTIYIKNGFKNKPFAIEEFIFFGGNSVKKLDLQREFNLESTDPY